jgi:hypothetical protein
MAVKPVVGSLPSATPMPDAAHDGMFIFNVLSELMLSNCELKNFQFREKRLLREDFTMPLAKSALGQCEPEEGYIEDRGLIRLCG